MYTVTDSISERKNKSMAVQVSPQHPIAYFCAEYGIDVNLPWYAGGLGILAGDTIKEASDKKLPFVGIGLLYRGDQMVQEITEEGLQQESDFAFDPVSAGIEHVYVDEGPLFVKVHLSVKEVWLRVWKKTFSDEVVLYLLDAETDQNELKERNLTRKLYFGTDEEQFQQQLLLGIGGVKVLRKLGIVPSVYHMNEGRPAFLHWQLIRALMDTHRIDYTAARQLAVDQTVYTNHTLVPAGNKQYQRELIEKYAAYYADKMNINVERLLLPGMNAEGTAFSVTDFALNSSRKANGVSKFHSKLSEEYWPNYQWASITNGVHLPTWQDSSLPALQLMPNELWQAHLELKKQTESFIKQKTGYGYNSEDLIIGWARRLAGYKQLNVLFSDLKRLKSITHNPDQKVQLLIAGKVHQGDEVGKKILQEIIGFMQKELSGQALFVPNYNIEIAKHLTRGVDVWLNTPELGHEACGTSGMKAISNGVLQLSVADGWLAEIDFDKFGWKLDHEHISASIYQTLEESVVPAYYQRDEYGIPIDWVNRMIAAIAKSNEFSSTRMLDEYVKLLYS